MARKRDRRSIDLHWVVFSSCFCHFSAIVCLPRHHFFSLSWMSLLFPHLFPHQWLKQKSLPSFSFVTQSLFIRLCFTCITEFKWNYRKRDLFAIHPNDVLNELFTHSLTHSLSFSFISLSMKKLWMHTTYKRTIKTVNDDPIDRQT